MAPPLHGIHHLKFPVSNIDTSLEWYKRVLDAKHLEELDHFSDGKRYAVELKLPFVIVELRLDAAQAAKHTRFDPLTFAVQSVNELEEWSHWLDECNVKHSRVLLGVVGHVLVFEDPDERFLRLYTMDTHEKTDEPDKDDRWL